MVKNQGAKQREQRILGDCCNGKPTGSVLKETLAVSRHDTNKRAKPPQPNPSPRASTATECEKCISGRMFRLPCKDYLKGTCSNSFCEKWHPPNCLFYKSERWMQISGKSALMRIAKLMNSQAKGLKGMVNKSAVVMLKSTTQLGCVFQDMEPPKSSSILRKSSDIRKPIRCVQLTKAVVRHANIRDRHPSLGLICPGDHHQRNPYAPKFEDRSQERRYGKSDVPVKQRGGWLKAS